MIIYLCGSMTQDKQHAAWREEAAIRLSMEGHGCLSPMRKEELQDAAGLSGIHDARVSVARDVMDLKNADIVLINVLGIESLGRQSIGTWCEMGIAASMGLPIVLIADAPAVLGHPFVQAFATKVVPTMKEALDVILWLD